MGRALNMIESSMSGLPIPVLATNLLSGAWQEWVQAHHHKVVLSLIAMSVPLHKAEELAQTTWERLMDKQRAGALERIDMPGLAIAQARFLALDYLRKEQPARANEECLEEHALMARDGNPFRALLVRQQMEQAQENLSSLSAKAQHIFRLFYIEGMSAAEIATEVELTAQRVRQTLCEVRATLRTAIVRGES